MAIPQGYDPITLTQYLWFHHKCFTCPPTEFQNLFEQILSKARFGFMPIRPYGQDGDRKCDGLIESEGHFFQVYSPDELTQEKLTKKINDDLDGAVEYWRENLKRWTFVYNTRVGLPPDVPLVLSEQRKKYPNVTIDSLSNGDLWNILRGFSLQQRAEILGAPNGYEHLFLSPLSSNDEVRRALDSGWFVVTHDTMTPINVNDVLEAMKRSAPFGFPLSVRPDVSDSNWYEAAEFQKAAILDAVEKSRDIIPRFAVFSLSQIALCIHLGFVLSDRLEVRYFQFDRDRRTWRWPVRNGKADKNIKVAGLPENMIQEPIEVVIRVSLSATISKTASIESAGDAPVQIDLFVANPDVMWLKSEDQLLALGKQFRAVLAVIESRVPNCSRIHLFYAGPTGGAIIIGQQINPRTNPKVELYQYSRQTSPQHRHVLTLSDEPTA